MEEFYRLLKLILTFFILSSSLLWINAKTIADKGWMIAAGFVNFGSGCIGDDE